MKIRKGYVSNSSSSSFIIHVIDTKQCIPFTHHKGMDADDFITLLESMPYSHSESTQVEAEGLTSILDEFEGGEYLDAEIVSRMRDIHSRELEGKDSDVWQDGMYLLQISYCDHLFYKILCEFVQSGVIEILWGEDMDDPNYHGCICR